MQKQMPSRLLKSFLWIISFMMVAMGLMYFYGHANKVPSTLRESARILNTVYEHYDAVPVNTTGSRRVSWSAFGLLKVHKAASTTTQGIFLRYGWKRNLIFVLPPEYNAFRYPNIISLNESVTSYNIIPPPPGKSFDILCHHVVYDKHAWDKVLSPKAAKIGTVREPFGQFKSSLNYFNPMFLKAIKTPNPVRAYLKNPQKYELTNARWSFTNNRVAFEYGVDPNIIRTRNLKRFEKYLWDVLDKEFTFVLVNEAFDESLVIMRRKLNWELSDILYLSQNIRPDYKQDRYYLTEEDRTLHRSFAVFDYLLYNFFSKKLEQEMINAPRFEEELEHFRKVIQTLNTYCRDAFRWNRAMLAVDKSEWNEPFNVTVTDCKLLIKGEIPFTQDIRRKQYGYATWTW